MDVSPFMLLSQEFQGLGLKRTQCQEDLYPLVVSFSTI
jgi:hypothetical protein